MGKRPHHPVVMPWSLKVVASWSPLAMQRWESLRAALRVFFQLLGWHGHCIEVLLSGSRSTCLAISYYHFLLADSCLLELR